MPQFPKYIECVAVSLEVLLFCAEGADVRVSLVTWPVTKAPISILMRRPQVVFAGIGLLRVNTICPQRPPFPLVSLPGVMVALLLSARAPDHVGRVDPPAYSTVKTVPTGSVAL